MAKIFVASPRDVALERAQVAELVLRLNGEFGWIDRFEVVLWEEGLYRATRTFQPQINEALAACDIVVAILGMRIGTEVEDDFPLLPDGSRYMSGTAYEILASLALAERNEGRPAVYVFFKDEATAFRITRADAAQEAMTQWGRLTEFRQRFFEGPDGRSIRAFNGFDQPAAFAAKVDALLRGWIRERYGERPGVTWSIARQGSPYPGLRAFDARHADVFCGRDRKVARAIEALCQAASGLRAGRRRRPFLLIVGPSGAGKSSLMRAGLAPRLTRPGVIAEIGKWRTAAMRPGEGQTVFHALAQALLVRGEGDDPGGFGSALPELGEIFPGGRDAAAPIEALAQLLASAASDVLVPIVIRALDRAGETGIVDAAADPRGVHLLLLVDQFEDLLAEGADPEARTRFALILAALTDSGRVWAAATLRADLYGDLIGERPLIALTDLGAEYALAPPGDDELEEIVVQSAARAGLRFDVDAAGNRLEDRLLKDASGGDVLPLVQFTLSRLFEVGTPQNGGLLLTTRAYEELDGVDGAIERTARDAVADFDDADRTALRRLFRALVVPVAGASAATGRKALALRACPRDALPSTGAMNRVVAALLEARILQSSSIRTDATGPDGRPVGVAILRIAHERVLESWTEARSILEENQHFFRMRAEIEAQWSAWEAQDGAGDWLLPPGRPVAEAQSFMAEDTGGELPAPLHDFVAKSVARERERTRAETGRQRLMRRLRGAATALGGAAAVLAAFALFYWNQAANVAKASKDTVGDLVQTIGKDLSERDGVPPELVTVSLRQVDGLVDGLQERIGGDEALERARAQMKYHFANAYKRIGGNADPALRTAQASLDARIRLSDAHASDPDLRSERAEGHMLLGDLLRLRTQPKESLREFVLARDIQIGLAKSPEGRARPERRERWLLALSKTYTRVGDTLGELGESRATMRTEYTRALHVTAYLVVKEMNADAWPSVATAATDTGAPDERRASLWRELSWLYRKLGSFDQSENPTQARNSFESALCLRRAVAERSNQLEPKRDIGHSLRDIAGTYEKTGDRHEALIAHAAAYMVRRMLQMSNENQIDIEIDVAQSLHDLGMLFEKGGSDERGVALALLDGAVRSRRGLSIRLPGRDRVKKDFEFSQKAFRTLCVAMPDANSATPEDCRLPERLRGSGSYETAIEVYEHEAESRRAAAGGCLAPILQGLGDVAGDPDEPWTLPTRKAAP